MQNPGSDAGVFVVGRHASACGNAANVSARLQRYAEGEPSCFLGYPCYAQQSQIKDKYTIVCVDFF